MGASRLVVATHLLAPPRVLVPPHLLALFGITSSLVTSVVDLVLGELIRWVASSAGQLLAALGGVLTSTTEPDLTHGVSGELGVVAVIGALVALLLLLLAVIQAVVRQDLGGLLRAAFMRLPVAILLSAVAVELVSLGLQASDVMSGALLAAAGHPVEGLVASLTASLAATAVGGGAPGAAIGGFGALLLAVLVAVLSFVVWLELAVRSAAIAAAVLFLPVALAGIVLPATAHWAKRLVETLVALVLAKVVIAGVIALASLTVASGAGISSLVEGTALLLLAALAPFSVLRLVPFVEAGAVGHLDGLGHRSLRGALEYGGYAASLGAMAGTVAAGLGGGGGGGSGSPGGSGGGWSAPGGGSGGGSGDDSGPRSPVVDDVGLMPGVDMDRPEVRAQADANTRELMTPRERS